MSRRLRTRIAWGVSPPLVEGVSRVLWRLKVVREAEPPPPPFVVASNHHSFLDPPLMGAVLGPLRFLGLVDLIGNYRWLDTTIDAFGMIPVTRGKVPLGPIREALTSLESGEPVAVFPEGTRYPRFDPANALPGAAWLAQRADVPLLCVAIDGTEQVLGVDNKLRRGRIRLTIGPTLRADAGGRRAVDDLTIRWANWVASRLEPGSH